MGALWELLPLLRKTAHFPVCCMSVPLHDSMVSRSVLHHAPQKNRHVSNVAVLLYMSLRDKSLTLNVDDVRGHRREATLLLRVFPLPSSPGAT